MQVGHCPASQRFDNESELWVSIQGVSEPYLESLQAPTKVGSNSYIL
jgi:hypothetical protein